MIRRAMSLAVFIFIAYNVSGIRLCLKDEISAFSLRPAAFKCSSGSTAGQANYTELFKDIYLHDHWARRTAGILMPIFSLNGSRWGGNLGKVARDFVDYLDIIGFSEWYTLPIQETYALFGDFSPYNIMSSLAKEALLFIDPDEVAEVISSKSAQNLINKYEEEMLFANLCASKRVDYVQLMKLKSPVFEEAFKEFVDNNLYSKNVFKRTERANQFVSFLKSKPCLHSYGVYRVLTKVFNNQDWRRWSSLVKEPTDNLTADDILYIKKFVGNDRKEKQKGFEYLYDKFYVDLLYFQYLQFVVDEQWSKLKKYLESKNKEIYTDGPFYVGVDSWDVLEQPEMFFVDQDNNFEMSLVAGCPPDYYEPEKGQYWERPIFQVSAKFNQIKAWEVRRANEMLCSVHGFFIDHIRAISEFWAIIPNEKKLATSEYAHWEKGMGESLLVEYLRDGVNGITTIIGENMGDDLDNINKMIEKIGIWSMFSYQQNWRDNFAKEQCVLFSGNHNDDTMLGWWESLPAKEKRKVLVNASKDKVDDNLEFNWNTHMERIFHSGARKIVIPFYDLFPLGTSYKINVPGDIEKDKDGNSLWSSKMPCSIQNMINGDTVEIDEKIVKLGLVNDKMIWMIRFSGRNPKLVQAENLPKILDVIPSVTHSVTQIRKKGEKFSIWVCARKDTKSVNIYTDIPQTEHKKNEKRFIQMECIRELTAGTKLFYCEIEATELGRWFFTVKADEDWVGGYGQNAYLEVVESSNYAKIIQDEIDRYCLRAELIEKEICLINFIEIAA